MIKDSIITIFQKVFSDSNQKIDLETTPSDVDEWDSLGQIMLIQAVEEEFEISFDLDELMNFDSVGSIVDAVINKVK